MKINTLQFGELEINPDSSLTFPRGIPGFDDHHRYQLLHEDREGTEVFYLQSLDDAELAFSIVDPARFSLNYELELSDEDMALLQAERADELVVALMVYRPDAANSQKPPFPGGVAANINGPLVLNPGKKLGMQKVLVGPRYNLTLHGG